MVEFIRYPSLTNAINPKDEDLSKFHVGQIVYYAPTGNEGYLNHRYTITDICGERCRIQPLTSTRGRWTKLYYLKPC